jgi:hypothetical protein
LIRLAILITQRIKRFFVIIYFRKIPPDAKNSNDNCTNMRSTSLSPSPLRQQQQLDSIQSREPYHQSYSIINDQYNVVSLIIITIIGSSSFTAAALCPSTIVIVETDSHRKINNYFPLAIISRGTMLS